MIVCNWHLILMVRSSFMKTGHSDVLRNLVPFVQFKKREKHSWRSVNFSKVARLKLTLLHGCFSRYLNCTSGTNSRNASQVLFFFKACSICRLLYLCFKKIWRRICEILGLVKVFIHAEYCYQGIIPNLATSVV